MQNIINQFKRLYNDDGRNDISFDNEEKKLKEAVANLREAIDNSIRAATRLSYTLQEGPNQVH